MEIRKAGPEDIETIAALSHLLWQSGGLREYEEEVRMIISSPDSELFVSVENESSVGFAYCHLRVDYVEGTSSSPVGYLEGIYVLPEYRNGGHGAALVEACERWAKSCGCEEFASDCELGNDSSASFHAALGFTEANRIICFAKRL